MDFIKSLFISKKEDSGPAAPRKTSGQILNPNETPVDTTAAIGQDVLGNAVSSAETSEKPVKKEAIKVLSRLAAAELLILLKNENLTPSDIGQNAKARDLILTHVRKNGEGIKEINLADIDLPQDMLLFILRACPNMKSLDLSAGREDRFINDEALKEIPPALQSLNLLNCYGFTDKGISSLPKGLTTLSLGINKENIKTSGGILVFNDKNKPAPESYTDQGMASLPPRLESLTIINDSAISGECFCYLPESLTSLSMSAPAQALSREQLAALPKNLQLLSLAGSRLHYSALNLEELPKSLVSISIPSYTMNGLPLAGTKDLWPPHLRMLELGMMSRRTLDDVLDLLPDHLEGLKLKNYNPLTPEQIKKLPPNLTSLNLEECAIDYACLDELASFHLMDLTLPYLHLITKDDGEEVTVEMITEEFFPKWNGGISFPVVPY